MINTLKRRFVWLALAVLFVLLTLIVTGMNVLNYQAVISDADEVLTMLSFDSDHALPPDGGNRGEDTGNDIFGKRPLSPEVSFEARFFTVVLDGEGAVVHTDISRIATVDTDLAQTYAKTVYTQGRTNGFIDRFRYARYSDKYGSRIIFLDCGRKLDTYYNFLCASVWMAVLGLAVVIPLLMVLSGRIVRPIAESYEKQKRFITDAGHEIKTPLTIISANADLLEMEWGHHECLKDIQQQTERLTTLTNDLVYLSRMEEQETSFPTVPFPVSDLVEETVHAFRAMATTQEKEIRTAVQPMLTMRGDSKAIEKLISVLMNNALKYTPVHGVITVDLHQRGRQLVLTVVNPTASPVDTRALSLVFDRFYRIDSSRNTQTGGHGIGLSMARAIVTAHNGTIAAFSPNGDCFGITAEFPL